MLTPEILTKLERDLYDDVPLTVYEGLSLIAEVKRLQSLLDGARADVDFWRRSCDVVENELADARTEVDLLRKQVAARPSLT